MDHSDEAEYGHGGVFSLTIDVFPLQSIYLSDDRGFDKQSCVIVVLRWGTRTRTRRKQKA